MLRYKTVERNNEMGQDHIEEERYTEQNTLEEETNPILNSELESEYLKKSKKDAAKNFKRN